MKMISKSDNLPFTFERSLNTIEKRTRLTSEAFAVSHVYGRGQGQIDAPPAVRSLRTQRSQVFFVDIRSLIDTYVRQPAIGLAYDPFQELDASADPHLPDHLIENRQMSHGLWEAGHTVLLAPPGAGKSAQRAGLARDCRVWRDQRRIFSIVFEAPGPSDIGLPARREDFLRYLLYAATRALLLELAYRPYLFIDSPSDLQRSIRTLLTVHLDVDLCLLLSMLATAGTLDPLIPLVDVTATSLPARPSSDSIREFCRVLTATHDPDGKRADLDGAWRALMEVVLGGLSFSAIYILLDGVDAFPETARDSRAGLDLVAPLLLDSRLWATQPVYVKTFLPDFYRQSLQECSHALLTSDVVFDTISWSKGSLVQLLQQRLRAASRGFRSSFAAISTPGLGPAEISIIDYLQDSRELLPRRALRIAERILEEHVLRAVPNTTEGPLEPEDLDRALAWYSDGQLAEEA